MLDYIMRGEVKCLPGVLKLQSSSYRNLSLSGMVLPTRYFTLCAILLQLIKQMHLPQLTSDKCEEK